APGSECSSLFTRTGRTMTSSGSSQPGRRPNWSASSTTRGGIDETPIRLFEGPPEPLRQSSQAIGDDPPRLGSSGVLQGARGGARDPIPNPDQPVSARLRCERPQAGAEMEAGSERAQPNQRLKLAGADRSNGNGVFVPWRARDFRPLLLRRRASRPQLKRGPLG